MMCRILVENIRIQTMSALPLGKKQYQKIISASISGDDIFQNSNFPCIHEFSNFGEGCTPLPTPVTTPRTSRPYPHPPPLSPKAKSELMMIPPKSENYCCHCRTECPCTFGYSCRGCPARKGARPHHCSALQCTATGVLAIGPISNHQTAFEQPL